MSIVSQIHIQFHLLFSIQYTENISDRLSMKLTVVRKSLNTDALELTLALTDFIYESTLAVQLRTFCRLLKLHLSSQHKLFVTNFFVFTLPHLMFFYTITTGGLR